MIGVTRHLFGPRNLVEHKRVSALLAAGIWLAVSAQPTAAQTTAAGYPVGVGQSFRDCVDCPEMVVIPPGSFTMGSSPTETSRERMPAKFADREKPSHAVRVSAPLAVGKFPVTRAEFARFVQATGYSPIGSCETFDGSKWNYERARSWRDPGFPQTDRDPVVCVSWGDARAYVQFLSRETSRFYRLLTEAEWEYAARGGRSTARWWGDSSADQCRYANGADETAKRRFPDWTVAACRDGYVFTSPVGSFAANPFGLHDMLGNAKQWVEDCWRKDYDRAPAAMRLSRSPRAIAAVGRGRGGSWADIPWGLRAATRFDGSSGDRGSNIGFRVARKPAD